MKILHVSNHVVFGNGNVHAAVDLACAQAKNGHDVFFMSAGGDFVDLLISHDVTHLEVNQRGGTLNSFVAVAKLLAIIRKHHIDIVHAHMMASAIVGWLATRIKRIPLVTTVHNAFDQHAVLMGLGDRVIAVSEAVRRTMVKRGIAKSKIVSVLNGTLGVARLSSRPSYEIRLPSPAITTVCGLHDRKGVRLLIEAFDSVANTHPHARLNIIGEGPQEAEYREVAGLLPAADRIVFWGQLRDPRPYLQATDIFVLASLQDPCPLVIPEAREMGCAIVASNVDGIPEMLAVGGAGVLVEPGSAAALAQAIAGLLNSDEELDRQKAASLRDIEFFSIERVCTETLDVYRGLIKDSPINLPGATLSART